MIDEETLPDMPDMIGDFLVLIGAMKHWQLDHVLRLQKAGDRRLFGEIAISLGYINDAALLRFVEEREKDRLKRDSRAS